MKRLRVCCLGLLAVLAIAACAWAQDVKTDYDHHVDFSQYRTYYWQKIKTTDPLAKPHSECRRSRSTSQGMAASR